MGATDTASPATASVSSRVLVRPLREEQILDLARAVADSTSEAQIRNRWSEQAAGYRQILVAEVEGQVVGTVSINQSAGGSAAMHLFALDVGAEWRNRGIGAQIVRHVVDEARRRGCRRVFLEVRIDNPARRLYHRLGFRRVGGEFNNTWWRYLDDGTRERVEEPSLRMVRRIR